MRVRDLLCLPVFCLGCDPDAPLAPATEQTPRHSAVAIRPLECAPTDERTVGEPSYQRFALQYSPPEIGYLRGGGTSVGDVDGDGDKDIILQAAHGPVLYRNPGRQPEDILPEPGTTPSSTVLVDIDADGDLDLYVGYYGTRDLLLMNDGAGYFEDETSARMPGLHPAMTVAASFADIDGDGDLDGLMLSMGAIVEIPDVPVELWPAPSDAQLWINQGDGVFEDIGHTLPDDLHSGYTLAGGLHDLDRDGHVDLFALNDFGVAFGGNQWLLGNGDGTFRAPAPGHGLDFRTTAMGLAIADINDDGYDDIAVPYFGGVSVHESFETSGSVAWFDSTVLHIAEPMPDDYVAFGGVFADVDNDGDFDLHVSAGRLDSVRWPNPVVQTNRLYLDEGASSWSERAAEVGLEGPDQSRGAIFSDINGNGSLDLVQASLNAPAVYFARCSTNGSLRVALRQEGPNPRAIGADISLLSGPTQRHTLRAGGISYASSGPAEAHFGLGDATTADIRIDWPDGESTTLTELPARSFITVDRSRL